MREEINDGDGGRTDGSRPRMFYRRRKLRRRLRSKIAGREKAIHTMGKILESQKLPSNVEKAATSLYSKAVETHTLLDTETLLAAAAYAACRQCGLPLTLAEIADRSNISKKDVGKSVRWLTREMNLKLRPASPLDYLGRFCQQLQTGKDIESTARDVLQRAEEKEVTSGRGATGMAAAAIYIASLQCGDKITQREIAKVAAVAEVPIRNRYQELVEQLNLTLDI